MKTKITELLGIKYPIIQGGMAWTSDANLAAAVSNAGGHGPATLTLQQPYPTQAARALSPPADALPNGPKPKSRNAKA